MVINTLASNNLPFVNIESLFCSVYARDSKKLLSLLFVLFFGVYFEDFPCNLPAVQASPYLRWCIRRISRIKQEIRHLANVKRRISLQLFQEQFKLCCWNSNPIFLARLLSARSYRFKELITIISSRDIF